MSKERLEEARAFLEDLAEHPPVLPYEPTLLPLLFAATRDDSNASVDDITALIESSQKLASKVLSLANSAAYGLESTVTSLRRAISILGFREVRTLVVMVGAVSAIKGVKLPKTFDATGLWKHQLKTASIAKILAAAVHDLAKQQGTKDGLLLEMAPDEAYAAGLLHDIGKVFLAGSRPGIWETIETIRTTKGISFDEAEDEYWGMDHALVGAQVLHHWKLPLLLTDPINWHHAPELAPSLSTEARLLAAANILAHEGLDEHGAFRENVLALLPVQCDPVGLAASVAVNGRGTEAFSGLL